MRIEDAYERWARIAAPKMIPALIISAATIIAVAMAAGRGINPPRPGLILTGMVSDSICGSDHGIRAKGDPECTRACVELGARYALMVGKLRIAKKMYILHGHEADLEEFAGKEVTVKGRALGRDGIIVDQVDRSYSQAVAAMN